MLSSDWATRRRVYDFLVIGSGYGGSIVAARLATADLNPKPTLCILERGMEWQPGAFPDRMEHVLAATRSTIQPLGLYEVLHLREMSVVSGSGLGGTSLIGAGVAALPDPSIFQRHWPAEFSLEKLLPYYRHALEVLDAKPHPRAQELKKVQALERRAREAGDRATALMLAINFSVDGVNPYGVAQKPCIDCGDCITGCNVGAMNSLDKNYLAMARGGGAEIFTQVEVHWLEKLSGGGWRVHGSYIRSATKSESFRIDATNLILAAGTIRSAEILLRSRQHGLSVSGALGSRFSGNGDFFGLAYNGEFNTRIEGFGNHPDSPLAVDPPGPTIVAGVRTAGQHPAWIEGVSLPSAYCRAAAVMFAAIRGESTWPGNEAARRDRMTADFTFDASGSSGGAMDRSLFYLALGLRDRQGQLSLEMPFHTPEGVLRVDWNDSDKQLLNSIMAERLRRHARSMGAQFIQNPMSGVFRGVMTPHPIGGCPIGDDPDSGAVDPYGRVFAEDGGIQKGLFVVDGSIVPAPLGVNPMLTICALAEYIAGRMIRHLEGEPYPESRATFRSEQLDSLQVGSCRESELERLFDSAPGGPAGGLTPLGDKRFDVDNRVIANGQSWRGFLPPDHTVNPYSAPLFGGFVRSVVRERSRLVGITEDTLGKLRVRSVLKEVKIKQVTGDLKPRSYIVVSHLDQPWEGCYEVLRPVSPEIVLGRAYLGKFPQGRRLCSFVLVRRYGFDRMTTADHHELYDSASAPESSKLEGVWGLDAIGSVSSSGRVAFLRFISKTGGRLESALGSAGLMEQLFLPSVVADRFNAADLHPLLNEVRRLADDLLIGRQYFDDSPELSSSPAAATGLLRRESTADGSRYCFHFLLSRLGDLP